MGGAEREVLERREICMSGRVRARGQGKYPE